MGMTPLTECRELFLPHKDMEWTAVTHSNTAAVHADRKFPLIAVGQLRRRGALEWRVKRIERKPDFSVAAAEANRCGQRTGPWEVWVARTDGKGDTLAFDPGTIHSSFKLPRPARPKRPAQLTLDVDTQRAIKHAAWTGAFFVGERYSGDTGVDTKAFRRSIEKELTARFEQAVATCIDEFVSQATRDSLPALHE